ncbi:hypothetical protein [Cellvibrio japonicus]|uniref:Uncharacterized protein n=1 Tax=Cellvibrio japonicus (strain Ueda107) TaxID=498211 RepID=B3PKE4_CELJU|nr:hypothetical protein [Cellvibrio japonicus]ACE84372.1 hypothetical protein CJA_2412 [Cellvibrio japonicus Ueda107]QEI12813.1 hypothetical protein FY117_11645 [Cellvibrio japonicus]QEI16387.1 hypothetical protein FY116_11650 [Cellvibrio japonicus]QEI19965.1 hypothetical protein FY115_11645 [Cellvibrio japonicus]
MKLLCALLGLLLLGLGIHYITLRADFSNLEQQLFQQQQSQQMALDQQRQDYEKQIRDLREFIAFGQASLNQTRAGGTTATAELSSSQRDTFSAIQADNIARTIDKKYQFLLGSLSLSSQDQHKLHELLREREQILGSNSVGYFSSPEDIDKAIRQQQEALADIDYRITQLLRPDEVKTYELLKDSSYEQYQMNDFYNQLGDVSSLTEDKRRTLLLNKLEQKQAFNKQLEITGTAINKAHGEEKQYLLTQAHQALHDYKDNYLRQAREQLTPEQFDRLREYEQQHFDEIWQSLKAGWGVE